MKRPTRRAEAQRLQSLGRLAGGIAHDFNNLLTAIRLAAEAIGERDGLDPDSRADAARIQMAAASGAALVARLLAFVRQQAPQPGPVCVNDAVGAVAAMLARLLGERIAVDLDLAAPAVRVQADRALLDQCLVNLAVNARDAMPEGGRLALCTRIAVLTQPTPGFPDATPTGRYVVIEVADTGGGIPPAVLPRIFEPFFTTRHGQPGMQGGTGLGLATVHAAIRESGGFLSVETTVGQGTRMRIHLPVMDMHVPPAVPAGRCVLLVEDEAPVRLLAERALTRRGWQVLAAGCGEDALALLDAGALPDAVVCDLALPGMDGAAVVRAVRARLGRPDLPAILASGYATEPLRAAMAAAGVGFLAKPYGMAELADRLELCLVA